MFDALKRCVVNFNSIDTLEMVRFDKKFISQLNGTDPRVHSMRSHRKAINLEAREIDLAIGSARNGSEVRWRSGTGRGDGRGVPILSRRFKKRAKDGDAT